MQRFGIRARFALLTACSAAIALAPAPASAQYVAPPPDPGFTYIFDGSPTGSDASFDKWVFASGTAAQSATQGRATLDPVEGSFLVGASPFGAYWYPVRPLGDAVIKLQYTVQDTPASTRNGGIMIRSPEIRYTGATTNDVLAQKPTGYSYELCPGALPVCGRLTPADSTTYSWAGADGPFPPASGASDPPFLYSGAYCARTGTHNVTNLAGTGALTTNGNANNHQHWTQVYCGHEVQINETLTGGGPQPSTDPIKTGLDLRVPQPERQAVEDQRAAGQGRLARHGDPHGRPAVHGAGRRRGDQPVRQLGAEDRLAQRRPADDGAPARARLPRPPDPRRQRPHLLPPDPGQGPEPRATSRSTSSRRR